MDQITLDLKKVSIVVRSEKPSGTVWLHSRSRITKNSYFMQIRQKWKEINESKLKTTQSESKKVNYK